MQKLLPILIIVMLFVAGGTGYFTISKYIDYKNKDNTKKVEIIESIVSEEVKETTDYTYQAPTNEMTKNEPSAIEVYNYAQTLFDKYTNYGATYVPEIHDDIVLRETAAHFGISVADTDRLHYQGAMDSLK